MITVSKLDFKYPEGEFRLCIAELVIERASTVAFIGPSGTGKTTLLNIIAGIVSAPAGRVVTNGVDVSALNDRARREFRIKNIGLVFQEFELLSYLDVLDNILLPYRINPAMRLTKQVRTRAVELATEVGIGDKLRRNADLLSQGERQRVAVCRSLLPEPALILADEPTGNLDPANKDRVLDIVFDYVTGHDTTLVTVTHDHALLGRFERVIEFSDFHTGSDGDGGREVEP
ncbi:MAG: ATP-binding cassette domain-containing protein [Candidatus Latescibacterota bacterium]|nr:MAG: ATP-binding cassette domain-containing protein [Candidatus Latescibacterota bacterium]